MTMMAATTLKNVLLIVVMLCLVGIGSSVFLSEASKATQEEEAIKINSNSNSNNDSKNSGSVVSIISSTDAMFVSPLQIRPTSDIGSSPSRSSSGSMLRGANSIGGHDDSSSTPSSSSSSLLQSQSQKFPPIPPIHPHHSGSIHYSSIMKDGVITYRREINAPCDNGMLIFTVGVASKEAPYQYELYDEAYLYSDNAGLCIAYPTYNGYEVSSQPFWTLGIDPETVTFTNLIVDPSSMHRVSSRELKVINPTTDGIQKSKIGDYIIMAKHNFYSVNYYKQLKAYINSWKTRETDETRLRETANTTSTTIIIKNE